jgi:iron complex transport system ATP-binding protein
VPGEPLFADLDDELRPGEVMGIVGPNGAGKSTLLRAVSGAVRYSGAIEFEESPFHRRSRRERARTVAVVPQEPTRPDGMTVLDYVLLGRTPYVPYLGVESSDDIAVVTELLDTLELTDLAIRPVTSLSGGEFQRAVLARALAQQAPLLLLDEPTSSLDLGHVQLALGDQLEQEIERPLEHVEADEVALVGGGLASSGWRGAFRVAQGSPSPGA